MEKLNENIKFSIVIPTYNRAGFIIDTIESVLHQDYSNFEIIVVDDGSTDNTEEIVCSVKSKHLFYFKKINEERGVARNFGFKKANGDYVLFFDSDDLMYSFHLSTLHNAISSFDGNVNFIATKYELTRNNISKPSSIQRLSESWYTKEILLNGNVFACHFCIKRDNPDLHLFIEDRQYAIMEDWLFLMQNLVKDKIYVIDKITISINDHDDRSMRGDNSIIINKNLLARDWILQNIPLTSKEKNILVANSYYFCAIHSYIDNNRRKAMRFLKKGTATNGFRIKEFVLFVKILIGIKTIGKIANLFKS